MIKFVLKIFISWLNESKRRRAVIIFAIGVLLFVICLSFLDGDKPVPPAIEHAAYQILHEANRTERIIDAVDKRKEAEINAVQKNRINNDDVLDTLDALLGSHSGK